MGYFGYNSLYHKNMTSDSLFEKKAFYKISYNQKTFSIPQLQPRFLHHQAIWQLKS